MAFRAMHRRFFVILSIPWSVGLLVVLCTTAGAMQIKEISVTDGKGRPVAARFLEIPGKDAPKEKAIGFVPVKHPINPESEYIVDARGYIPEKFRGRDLMTQGRVQLRKTPIRFALVPQGNESPRDGQKKGDTAPHAPPTMTSDISMTFVPGLQGQAGLQRTVVKDVGPETLERLDRIIERNHQTRTILSGEDESSVDADLGEVLKVLLENTLKDMAEKEKEKAEEEYSETERILTEARKAETPEKEEPLDTLPKKAGKGEIESVVQHLQPIFVFNTAWEKKEPEKGGESVPLEIHIDLDGFFLPRWEDLFEKKEKSSDSAKDWFLEKSWDSNIWRFDSDAPTQAPVRDDDPGVDEPSFFGFWGSLLPKALPKDQSKSERDPWEVAEALGLGIDTVLMFGLHKGGSLSFPDSPRSIQPAAVYPDDPLFSSRGTWGQDYPDQWGLHRIGFTPVRDRGERSLWPRSADPIIVAVIDTGVDRFHPEISGALWCNAQEIPDNGKDDDDNGYVDDVYGWNFVHNNNDIQDVNGHGTIAAGIIAALINNGVGMAGVNPWARIMPIKAVEWDGNGWAFDIAKSILYAVNNGARVINISLGGRHLNFMEYLAVLYARSKGVIVVAAAGNAGINTEDFSPAGLPGVVTVAATDPEDGRTPYSCWGGNVDIAAPGVDILSLRARRTDLLKFLKTEYRPGEAFVGDKSDYYRASGTSFSAPFVSGVASLIFSRNPGLSATQVTRMILHSARDINVPGWDRFTGYGLLDARAALKADPDFYVLSRILRVSGTKKDGELFVEISGRAKADKFSKAWIEAGEGENPSKWVKISEDIAAPVDNGRLALVSARHFRGGPVWTLRLVVAHQNGFQREARFLLTLKR